MLRPAPWALLRTGAAFVSVVAAFFLVFGLWDERYVLGQPDEIGFAQNFHPIGTIHQGKSSCDGVEVRVLVSRPRPDLPERTARLRACDGDYRSGESVTIRRVPGHPGRTYSDPLTGVDFVFLSLLVSVTAVGAWGAGVWEERRGRKRQE